MYICICNEVTDRDILEAADRGATSMKDLREELNVGTCCGSCAMCAKGILKQAHATQSLSSSAG